MTSNMFIRVTVLRLRDRDRGRQQQEVRRSDRHLGADTSDSVNTASAADKILHLKLQERFLTTRIQILDATATVPIQI